MKYGAIFTIGFLALVSALAGCASEGPTETYDYGTESPANAGSVEPGAGAGGSVSGGSGGSTAEEEGVAGIGDDASSPDSGFGGGIHDGGGAGDVADSGGIADRGDTGGTGGTSGSGGTGGTGGSGSADSRPRCLTKPSQVVLIGDSYINWVSHTFPADLAGEAGVTYRNYAVGAFSMGSGGIGFIPPQFDQAFAEDPDIIASVMTGGGNDILVPDIAQFPRGGECKNSPDSPTIEDCQKIVQKAIDASVTLMHHTADTIAQSATDGRILDIIYFFYPHVPEGTLVGGLAPNAILDYALPKAKAACDNAYQETGGKLRCHFVDLIPVLDDANGDPILANFAPTDIHPNTTGSALMAKAVWAKMKDNCVAQPASSGCCAP